MRSFKIRSRLHQKDSFHIINYFPIESSVLFRYKSLQSSKAKVPGSYRKEELLVSLDLLRTVLSRVNRKMDCRIKDKFCSRWKCLMKELWILSDSTARQHCFTKKLRMLSRWERYMKSLCILSGYLKFQNIRLNRY